MIKIGDRVHYWSRRAPQAQAMKAQSLCHRAIVREISTDGHFARVERLNAPEAVPIQTVEVKRLHPGWNNWTDPEGRLR